MKKKSRSYVWLWLIFFLIAGAAILGAYFFGMKKGSEEKETPVIESHSVAGEEPRKTNTREEQTPPSEPPKAESETAVRGMIEEKPAEPADMCLRIETDVFEFFRYLDKRNYIQHLEEGINTYDRFKKLVLTISSHAPIPAGEGIDSSYMTRNIFHFFRILDRNDLRLLKEVLRNEGDTLEMNLDLFFRWFMLGNRCPDPEGVRPSLDVLYQYAGFFLNTIGGRAYLFRRPAPVRLLISYYCLLIIHEADKRGLNSYGLDIFPYLSSIQKEMEMYSGFLFQNEYLQRLERLSVYYIEKR